MARVSGSMRVVLAALGGNLAVAAVKFAAFAATRSTAMLSEAIHSVVDTVDQVLLLIGQRRSSRPPDEEHPFGYGMETYFWSFIVALLIFFAGGLVAVRQGVDKVLHPQPIEHPWVSFAVLAASALFEGFSLRTAYREYRAVIASVGVEVNVLRFIGISKDPSLFSTLLEDSVALVGLAIAAAGIAGAAFLGQLWADGAASIAIGLLLLAVALVLTNESRSLIAGEAAAPVIRQRIREAAQGVFASCRVRDVSSLQLGPQVILVLFTVEWRQEASVEQHRADAAELVRRVKAVDPRICEVAFTGPEPPPG